MSNITVFKPEQVGPAFNSVELKAQAAEIAKQCKEIVIADDTSLEIAQAIITRANKSVKNVETIRVSLKAPILDMGKRIDAVAKDLTAEIEMAIKDVKENILKYHKDLKEKQRIEQERIEKEAQEAEAEKQRETDRIKKITDWILSFEKNTIAMIDESESIGGLSDIYTVHIKTFPADNFFEEFLDDAKAAKERVKLAGKSRKEYLQKIIMEEDGKKAEELRRKENKRQQIIQDNVETKAEELKEKVTEVVENVEAEAELKTADLTGKSLALQAEKVSGITRNWDFEIVDLNKVPRSYLKVDEPAIRAWIKQNKEVLKDGEVISGIKYFIKEGVRTGS